MSKQTNLEKMLQSENKNVKLFAQTIYDLKLTQGFYKRAEQYVNKLNDKDYESYCKVLEKQNFKDTLDVILWLEEE